MFALWWRAEMVKRNEGSETMTKEGTNVCGRALTGGRRQWKVAMLIFGLLSAWGGGGGGSQFFGGRASCGTS